jgi:hypothetical protein
MRYNVTARLIAESAAELLRKLTDGTIETQKPDGKEIVASMNRAVIDQQQVVRWSESCYCAAPLQHERETVYDHHFTELDAVETETLEVPEGEPFIEYLRRISAGSSSAR